MIQIIDDKGNKIKNHFRVGNSIVVNDDTAIKLYKKQVEDRKRIDFLEEEISEIKKLLYKILENDKGSSESK